MAADHCNSVELRRRLLRWYRRNRRDLPWRAQSPAAANPYHVLVSETMLQQTQVATVVPYFLRFIEAFPTAAALAAADEQRVLRLWQGLGYYRRARHLHATARMIIDQFHGEAPATVDDLLRLPGVGRYTAGAIASIAYGKPEPILDGNAARVLARWFAVTNPVDDPSTRDRLWTLAEQLVPKRNPGDFNQAIMELGALVCTPQSPDCPRCPLSGLCEARRNNRVDHIPVKRTKPKPKAVTHLVLAMERRGRFLFHRRPETGLWSNMWQLPTAETLNGQSMPQWSRGTFGLDIETPTEVGRFTHQTTHRTIRFIIRRAHAKKGRIKIGRWRRLDQLDDLPLAVPQQRAVDMLLRAGSTAKPL